MIRRPRKSDKKPKYVAPKVAPMHYEEDTLEARKQRALDKAKKRALSSSLIRELRNEFDDAPEEISEVTVGRKKLNKKQDERTRYEEDNFVRLNLTRKEKRREEGPNHGLLTVSDLGRDLTRFEDVTALRDDLTDLGLGPKRKKKKMAKSKPKKAKRRLKRK